MRNRSVLHAAAFLLAACSNPSSPSEDAGTDDSTPACWGAETLEDFFGLGQIHTIAITVPEAGVDALGEEPRRYTHGSVAIDACTYHDVGVRLKGGAGSFIPLGGDYPEISNDGNGRPGKTAFIIDFNRFVSGVDHIGMKKLTINNMVQDPTCIHEYLGYALFREGGVPASRTGYAIITFNGEEKGLYALIEPTDDDQFLERFYGSDDGNLYEGVYGADFNAPPPDPEWEWFDQDNGTDTSMDDIRAVVDDLDAIGPGDDALDTLETHFDMDEYLAFAATELYLGHWDGYAWSANNYKVHHDLATDTWTFVPWGIDQLFEDDLGRYSGVMQGPGPSWEHGGRIHSLCLSSSRCRTRLAQAFRDVLDRVDSMDLLGMAGDARDLVEEIVLEEADAAAAADHGGRDRAYEAWETVTHRIENRRSAIEAWLPCLTGEGVDMDRDTHDGCTVDCDDENPGVHPGATEECNFIDDDCNSVIDDPPGCPRCMGPESRDGDATEYYFCFERLPWVDAHQYCLDQGQDLASIHEEETWEFLTFGMMERFGSWMTWIGLNDRDTEGTFTWTDGSPLDFEPWCEECPRPWGELDDCVVTSPEGWFDIHCDEEPHAFVCQVP
jgi:hypothetical protein